MAEIYKGKDVELEMHVIADSVTIKKGDLVKLVNYGVDVSNAVTDLIYGLCEGIVNKQGVPMGQVDSSDYDGTWTAATQTYVAAADNSTASAEMVHALVRPLTGQETLSMLLDATAATTTGSNIPGYYISVLTTNAGQLDESTAHTSNVLHLRLVDNGQGVVSAQDPVKEGNNVLVKVVELEQPRSAQA